MRKGHSPSVNYFSIALLVSTGLLLSACSSKKSPDSSLEVAVKGLHSAAISDDGRWTSVGSVHHGGSLWRIADGERLYNWNHRDDELTTILTSDFSPDNNWAMTAGPHSLVLWDMKEGKAVRYWTAPGEVLSIALSADANFALLGLSDHSAVLFDVKRGGVRRTFSHANRVRSVGLSNDGRLAVTGSEDYTAVLWDVASGKQLHRIEHADDVQMVAISPDGRLALSAAKYDKAVIWQTQSGELVGEVALSAESVRRGVRFTAATFNSNGSRLLTGRPDQIVQLWDTTTLQQVDSWKLPKRDAWKPTSAAVIAVGFDSNNNAYHAAASNGMLHTLKR
jgi:WD40 repeat protein